MKYFIPFLFFPLIISCSNNKRITIDSLVGEWKVENKENYEVWEKDVNNSLKGYSYSVKNNEKVVSETLSIKRSGDRIIYEATVPTQNDGKTIAFELNTEIDSILSFENDKHDFPKKIQYKIITKNEIEVTVSGNDGKGFSYIQIRQSQE